MNYCTEILYWMPTSAFLLSMVLYLAYALGKASQRKETALFAAENVRLRNKHLLHLSSKGNKKAKHTKGGTQA